MTQPPQFGLRDEIPRDGVRVVVVDGDLDVLTSETLAHHLEAEPLDGGRRVVVVDLAGCAFLDSTGLAVLVRLAERVVAVGGGFAVVASTPAVLRTFEVTGIDRRVDVLGGREEAIAAADGDGG